MRGWRSEDNFVELILSVHLYLGFGDLIQVIRTMWWSGIQSLLMLQFWENEVRLNQLGD